MVKHLDLVTSIIEQSATPQEAIKTMEEAEKELDSALHKVFQINLETFYDIQIWSQEA